MQNTKRNIYIDVMKGLLITLVVIGHLPFFDYNSRTLTLIYSFHLPAFLIIGGMLSHIDENTSFVQILSKRFIKTLVPYFVFYLISLILIPVNDANEKMQAILTIFRGIGDPNHAINLPLWFLTFYFCALTIFECIECLFYKIKILIYGRKKSYGNEKIFFVELLTLIFIAFIMFISFYYARIYRGVRLPFNLEISTFCLGFIYFGKIISIYIKDAIEYIKKNTVLTVFVRIAMIILVIIFTVFWYILSMNNGRIDLNARDYKNAFYMYCDAIIGFMIFAFVTYIVSLIPFVKNVFSYLGKNSLYILAYHVPSTIITYNIIVPLLPITFASSLSHNSLPSIFTLATFGILISLFASLIHKACHFPA